MESLQHNIPRLKSTTNALRDEHWVRSSQHKAVVTVKQQATRSDRQSGQLTSALDTKASF